MQAYKFNTFITEKGIIILPFIEPMLYNKQVEIIILPLSEQETEHQLEKINSYKTLLNDTENSNAFFGCAKGRFRLTEDFDKPLDDFNEYM